MITAHNFFDTLKATADVKDLWAFLDGLAGENHFEALEDIARRMVSDCTFELHDWKERSIFERLMECLVFGNDETGAWIALSVLPKFESSARATYLENARAQTAAKVAFVHSSDTIEHLLVKLPELETAALLFHEAIVRGKLIGATTASVAIYKRLKAEGHPLAWLPLELLHIETELPLRSYSKGAGGWGLPELKIPIASVEFDTGTVLPAFVEIQDEKRVELIGAADENWRNFSNGRNEVRIFEVSPYGSLSIEKTLPALGIESAASGAKFEEVVTLEAVFQHLFAISANGGAYSRGCCGAYGRLNAWKSLAGLCGTTLEMDAEEILETAMACRWGKFQGGEWFYDIFWDLGVVCLNPEREELVVLAATDVD